MNRRLRITDVQPLLAFLLAELGLKRSAIKQLLKFGAVWVNGRPVRQFDHPLVSGDEVTVGTLQTAAVAGRLERARIQLVYEDSALVAVDKPAGLLTVATGHESTDTLYVRLNEYLSGRNAGHRAHVVHRIDRETSGLVLFAKNESVKRLLQAGWAKVEKRYYAVVIGHPGAEQGTISNYLTEDRQSLQVLASDQPLPHSRLAVSHFRLLKTFGMLSLIEVRLETGRKHQVRVHLAGIGCPVVGDRRYGNRSVAGRRLALHAGELRLAHPLTGEQLNFRSRLPNSLRRLMS
ncbi:MAG: RluA family pseudouridine synthase [Pirellulales bacterium]|nr:RluA family pseudouridine synthase [Pirellulales bacterium]